MPDTFTFEEVSEPQTFTWEDVTGDSDVKQTTRPPYQLREPVPTTPQEQQAINIALQRVDPRWNVRAPEPTIGGLISKGIEWLNKIPAPQEPMPAPLTPIIAPPAVEESPEESTRRKLKEHIFSVEHPVRSGIGSSAEKLAMATAQPGGILGIAATPLAPEVMLPVWSALGTEGSLDAIQRIHKARQEGDRAKYYEAVADLGVQAPMALAPFVHAATPEPFSRSLQALLEDIEVPPNITELKPQQQEVPSAVQIRSSTPEVRGMPAQPGVDEGAMPAQESAGGIPPSVEGPKETPKPAEVPLTELPSEVQRASEKDPYIKQWYRDLPEDAKARYLERLKQQEADTITFEKEKRQDRIDLALSRLESNPDWAMRAAEMAKDIPAQEKLQADIDAAKSEAERIFKDRESKFKPNTREYDLAGDAIDAAYRKLDHLRQAQDMIEAVKEKAGKTEPVVPASEVGPQTITVPEGEKAPVMTAGEGAIPSAARPKRQVERTPDIIDEIQGRIGKLSITAARSIREKFKPTGAARKMFTRSGGSAADVALDALHRDGLFLNIETEDAFLQAIEDAAASRKAKRGQKSSEQREIERQQSQRKDFERAALEGRRGPGEPKKTQTLDVGELLEGDEFMLAGVKVKVKELVVDRETGEVSHVVLEDGRRFEEQTLARDATIKADEGTLIQKEPEGESTFEPEPPKPTDKAPKTELFEETPFNLAGEKLRQAEAPKPPAPQTGQTDLFALEKSVETPDPIKSADAAEALYGGPREAIAKLEEHLRVIDSDPLTKGKQFDPEQRARLKQVLALLRERADQLREGPGAQTRGQGAYPAIQQLTDQLEATPKVGTKQRLAIGEKIANAWAQKGNVLTKAIAKMTNAKVTAKHWWEGIRKASDLDSRLGEYDYAIQYSSAASKRAGEAIGRQMPDVTDREAAAILIDSARIASKDPNRLAVNPDALATPAEVRQVIKDALDILPADTPKTVRAAMERALDPSLDLRAFAEQLQQYYGIREQDAIGADLFSEGLQDYYTHIWKKEGNMPDSLRGAIATGRVNSYFQFSRQRKLPSLIEGILEGKTPILDPAKVVPFYNFTMDRAIASRTFIKALSDLKASDGRPAVDVRGGTIIPDRESADSPILVTPKTQAREIADYMAINHPALQGWKWTTNTPEGRNVMLRGDMVVHPEFHETLARFMEKSRLTAGKLMRGALAVGSTAKAAKLGLLPSTFHMVHVGTHAAFHWTNPFKWAPIDFEAPETRFAIEKGHLKLAPSPAELSIIEEGVTSPLLKKIPIYGRFIGAFSDFMFHQYIPRLKLNTFENAMARARSPLTATGRGLRAGRLTENDLAARIGDASNSAFGELNQLFLGKMGRDPQFQRRLRLIFLAPDFGEARLRFASKFFSRYGDEERIAIATMFGALYFGARLGNWLTHGDAETHDWRHAFEVKVKDSKGKHHWIGMRSVVGDLAHAAENPGQFTYVRLSPAYSRPVTDFLFGRDERTGRRLSFEDKFKRVAQAWEPIGLSGLNEPDRTLLESLGQSMGFANRRDMVVSDVARKAHEWLDSQGRRPISEVIPTDEPSYMKLRTALNIGKYKDARKILDSLLKTRSTKEVEKAMSQYVEHPYTGSQDLEKAWASTFTKRDAEQYLEAQKEKENTLLDFYRLIGGVIK